MKTKVTCLLLLVFIASKAGRTQTRFFLNDYPLTDQAPTISLDSAKSLFRQVQRSPILEYSYTRGGCDYRAHAVYLLLKRMGVPTFKIWNFAACKVFLAGGANHHLFLKVKDAMNLSTEDGYYRNCTTPGSDSVTWGYHVAPVLVVQNGERIDTLVIDPALSNGPLEYRAWVARQLQPQGSSYVTFLNGEQISFQTESQYKKCDGSNCNNCSGNDVITGIFYNDSYSIAQGWIEQSISKGRVFMEYYRAEVQPLEAQLQQYPANTTNPTALRLACQLAEKKALLSSEAGFNSLPASYKERYTSYVKESTALLFP